MSRIVRHGDVVDLCGQTASGTAVTDAAGQTREILARIAALLAEGGTDRSRLLAAMDHLADISDDRRERC
jgi:enamine deaminase RidA (YjgF/YER057c/UK114 family)